VKSKFDRPRLFGEVTTILIALVDFNAVVYFSEEDGWVEFDFGYEDEEGFTFFFEEKYLDELAELLFESGLDSDGQGISLEDQADYPSGAVTQVTFYGFSTLEMLTSRNLVLQYQAKISQLKAKTPFEGRVNDFLMSGLNAIYATSECIHKYSEKDDFNITCQLCGLRVWDPATLAELTGSWH
jgi:hypothetical protein